MSDEAVFVVAALVNLSRTEVDFASTPTRLRGGGQAHPFLMRLRELTRRRLCCISRSTPQCGATVECPSVRQESDEPPVGHFCPQPLWVESRRFGQFLDTRKFGLSSPKKLHITRQSVASFGSHCQEEGKNQEDRRSTLQRTKFTKNDKT